MIEPNVCELKHTMIDKTLAEHDRRLSTVEGKQEIQESRDAASAVQIKNLYEQIKTLVADVKRSNNLLITTLLSVLFLFIGFFLWYVQNK